MVLVKIREEKTGILFGSLSKEHAESKLLQYKQNGCITCEGGWIFHEGRIIIENTYVVSPENIYSLINTSGRLEEPLKSEITGIYREGLLYTTNPEVYYVFSEN